MNEGDAFYTFGTELFGRGYEILKHWVLRVRGDGRYDYAGGAVGSSHRGDGLPYPLAGHTPREAFEKGRKAYIQAIKNEKAELRKKIAEATQREKALRALKFERLGIRGGKETFERFRDNWENDCY